MEYSFGSASVEDVNTIFALYVKRIEWMDAQGISQWNVTAYLDSYPIGYYEDKLTHGNLYVLKLDDKIAGAVVILENDPRWKDQRDSSAYYVHNLVTDPVYKGIGRIILHEAEKLAVQNKKHYLRLDCASDNAILNHYYESLGYALIGKCEDGEYIGNRREKKMSLT